jgi:hypothetical protein
MGMPRPSLKTLVFLAAGVIMIISLVMTARARYMALDPHMSLLASQSIIQKGTIKLDTYASGINLKSHSIKV